MKIKISLILFALLCCLPTMLQAQERKVQHKPFIDTRVLHYGFFVGIHDQGLSIENNGFIDEATGRQCGGYGVRGFLRVLLLHTVDQFVFAFLKRDIAVRGLAHRHAGGVTSI